MQVLKLNWIFLLLGSLTLSIFILYVHICTYKCISIIGFCKQLHIVASHPYYWVLDHLSSLVDITLSQHVFISVCISICAHVYRSLDVKNNLWILLNHEKFSLEITWINNFFIMLSSIDAVQACTKKAALAQLQFISTNTKQCMIASQYSN